MVRCTSTLSCVSIGIAALGLNISTAGCVSASDTLDPDFEAHLKSPYRPTGEMDPENGLDPDAYHATWPVQQQAMAMALTSDGETVDSVLTGLGLPGTPAGDEVLSYLVRCGLPAGAAVKALNASGVMTQFVGEGIMNIATNWRNAALSASEAGMVQQCMLALLNPNGPEVIHMSGANVVGSPSTGSGDLEAVWVARVAPLTTPPIWTRYVYGLLDDGSPIMEDLTRRVCANEGLLPGPCGIEVRTLDEFDSECNAVFGVPGAFQCGGTHVIATYVKP